MTASIIHIPFPFPPPSPLLSPEWFSRKVPLAVPPNPSNFALQGVLRSENRARRSLFCFVVVCFGEYGNELVSIVLLTNRYGGREGDEDEIRGRIRSIDELTDR